MGLSFGLGSGLGESDLRKLADGCLNRLDLGRSEEDVYDWVKQAVIDWPNFQDI